MNLPELSFWEQFRIGLFIVLIIAGGRELIVWILGTGKIGKELEEIKKLLKERNDPTL